MQFDNLINNINPDNYRQTQTVNSVQGSKIVINNKQLINFSSNDYLGLKQHPKVIEAFVQAADDFGVGAGSAHLISGHTILHENLAQELAEFTGAQKVMLFSTGYMANLGVLSALKGHVDWVVQDKLNHASLMDANQMLGLPIRRFLHNNLNSLKTKIKNLTGNGLIISENVFSMDGDRAPIMKINNICMQNNAIMMQDDAHGFGIFKPNIPPKSIYMATLGKAVGTFGAFIAGDNDLINFLSQKARPFTYTTAAPPALSAATSASLKIIKTNTAQEKLRINLDYFKKSALQAGIKLEPSESAIQIIIIGSSKKALAAGQKLFDAGLYVKAIRPPTVANGSARLRITICANHNQADIDKLISGLLNAI